MKNCLWFWKYSVMVIGKGLLAVTLFWSLTVKGFLTNIVYSRDVIIHIGLFTCYRAINNESRTLCVVIQVAIWHFRFPSTFKRNLKYCKLIKNSQVVVYLFSTALIRMFYLRLWYFLNKSLSKNHKNYRRMNSKPQGWMISYKFVQR